MQNGERKIKSKQNIMMRITADYNQAKLKRYIMSLFKHELVKDTIWTTFLSVLGKGVGFFIPFFIAAWFGVSSETDAFFFAYGLIIFLATIFSPVVESIIVPFIAEARAKSEDVGVFVGKVLGISGVSLCILSIFFMIAIKFVLPYVTRFTPEGLNLIYIILLESIPLVVLLVWTSVLAGSLNAYKIFSIPALSPAFRAFMTLSFIFAFKGLLSIHSIALGYVAGEIFRLGILLFLLKRLKIIRLKLSLGWEEKFGNFLKTSSYQLIGMAFLSFTPIINKTMASWLGLGNVSLLEYAERLYMIPVTLIGSGLLITLLSHWSERFQIGGTDALKQDVLKTVKVIGIIGAILSLLFIFTRYDLVKLAYDHGGFPREKIGAIASILGFYFLGLTPSFLSQIYVRAFLTRKDTKVLLYMAIFMFLSTIIFNLAFVKVMGVSGIALASSVVNLLAFIILFFIFSTWSRRTSQ